MLAELTADELILRIIPVYAIYVLAKSQFAFDDLLAFLNLFLKNWLYEIILVSDE